MPQNKLNTRRQLQRWSQLTMEEDLKYRQSSNNLTSLMPALKFLKPYKGRLALAILVLLLNSGLSLSFGQLIRVVIDNDYLTTNTEMLLQIVLAFAGIMVLLGFAFFFRIILVLGLGERVSADIRRTTFNHVLDLDSEFFDKNLSGEIQTRITTDTAIVQSVMSTSISMALRSSVVLLGGILLMFISNFKLTLIVFVMIVLVVIPVQYFSNRVRSLSRKSQNKIADAGAYIGETLQNIKTVHAFNHQATDKVHFEDEVNASLSAGLSHIRMRAFMTIIVFILSSAAMATVLWVGGSDVINNTITSGELAAFLFYAIAVAFSVSTIVEVAGDIMRAAGAMERILEILATSNGLQLNESTETLDQNASGHLRLDKLSFNYPSRPEKEVIQELSLSVEPGETIALVGHSGAGKSTLFDLLMRMYDPQGGTISIDNVPADQLDLHSLRENFAVVSQNPSIFSRSVLENIRYGKPEATLEEVEAAAEAAYAHEFIAGLPDRYDTYVGEAGMHLSGGQRQRIAIARAVLRDPKVLLLDEATSALDAKSEQIVQLALEKLMKSRTSIVIAHRLSTVINADRIAVMDAGKIIQVGKHQELLQTSPLYANLAKLQFEQD